MTHGRLTLRGRLLLSWAKEAGRTACRNSAARQRAGRKADRSTKKPAEAKGRRRQVKKARPTTEAAAAVQSRRESPAPGHCRARRGRRPAALPTPAPARRRKPGFYEAVAVYETRGPGAPTARFPGRRRASGRARALSRGTRAARTGPPVPAGLRARNRAAPVRPQDPRRTRLRRHRRAELRRSSTAPSTTCSGPSTKTRRATTRTTSWPLPSADRGRSVAGPRSPAPGHRSEPG